MTDASPQPKFAATDVSAALGRDVTFLGAGAFGETWRVDDEAYKIISKDDYPLARLQREVEGLSRVSSPFVVDFRGSLNIALLGKQRPCLRFEYIEGGDVEAKLKKSDLLPLELVPQFLTGLLEGIAELHKTSTIHRDIKPANIALRDGDWARPIILDLGLAKQLDSSTITIYPGHVGTYPYMSPEQLQGRRARKAADLWAIGVTVRQAISGTHPFYHERDSYTLDEALDVLSNGPSGLPSGLANAAADVLNRLTSVREYERGSAVSNLRRLSR
ncbi:protein kinase [Streptomyces sp. NPDC008139]|uniref:serine/threonine-protein kinase n=1 Tax=Streptomyces sp. NPDC008139 TaxID=3364814 RepID=UPI0036EFEBB2